jgi:hypothetical protein
LPSLSNSTAFFVNLNEPIFSNHYVIKQLTQEPNNNKRKENHNSFPEALGPNKLDYQENNHLGLARLPNKAARERRKYRHSDEDQTRASNLLKNPSTDH